VDVSQLRQLCLIGQKFPASRLRPSGLGMAAHAEIESASRTLLSCGDSDEATLTTTHRHIAIPVSLPISPAPAHHESLRHLERIRLPAVQPTRTHHHRDFARLRATANEDTRNVSTNDTVQQTWVKDNREVFWPRASSATLAVRADGPTSTTRRDSWARPSSLPPSVYVPTTWNPSLLE
jgi:hypothetical protein